jgi:hypothetical protein
MVPMMIEIAIGVHVISSDKYLLLFKLSNQKFLIQKIFSSLDEAVVVGETTVREFIEHCITTGFFPDGEIKYFKKGI